MTVEEILALLRTPETAQAGANEDLQAAIGRETGVPGQAMSPPPIGSNEWFAAQRAAYYPEGASAAPGADPTFGGLQSAAPQAPAVPPLPTPVEYPGPGAFNPKDPGQWQDFRSKAAGATQGINQMPFVFGGRGGYGSLNGMTPDEIYAKFYKGGGQPGSPTSPSGGGGNPLSSLLGGAFGTGIGMVGGLGGLGGVDTGQDFSGIRGGVDTGQDFSGIQPTASAPVRMTGGIGTGGVEPDWMRLGLPRGSTS